VSVPKNEFTEEEVIQLASDPSLPPYLHSSENISGGGRPTMIIVETGEGVDVNEGELTASFDGRTVSYLFGELDTLVLAYAATIHKSQGSEYPAVVIPVLTQHYAMLQRNLLYTGITRGKRLVVLVGQRKAVAIAAKNVSGRRRWSKLDEWLGRPPADARQLTE
jgi:hypothetical protein